MTCNLGVFLNCYLYLEDWQLWPGKPLYIMHQIIPIPESQGPDHNHLCPGHIPLDVLQCTLNKTHFKNHLEATIAPKYSGSASSNVVICQYIHITPLLCELHWLPVSF